MLFAVELCGIFQLMNFVRETVALNTVPDPDLEIRRGGAAGHPDPYKKGGPGPLGPSLGSATEIPRFVNQSEYEILFHYAILNKLFTLNVSCYWPVIM